MAPHVDEWIKYFCDALLQAQAHTLKEMEFLVKKTRFFDHFKDKMNARQKKVVTRIFAEGTKCFSGGLSAKNYVTITNTTPSTATRDLQGLVKLGALTKIGYRKSTRYYLREIS